MDPPNLREPDNRHHQRDASKGEAICVAHSRVGRVGFIDPTSPEPPLRRLRRWVCGALLQMADDAAYERGCRFRSLGQGSLGFGDLGGWGNAVGGAFDRRDVDALHLHHP